MYCSKYGIYYPATINLIRIMVAINGFDGSIHNERIIVMMVMASRGDVPWDRNQGGSVAIFTSQRYDFFICDGKMLAGKSELDWSGLEQEISCTKDLI
jgi:hypothetical protein